MDIYIKTSKYDLKHRTIHKKDENSRMYIIELGSKGDVLDIDVTGGPTTKDPLLLANFVDYISRYSYDKKHFLD